MKRPPARSVGEPHEAVRPDCSASTPPSTTSLLPVTNEDSSQAR